MRADDGAVELAETGPDSELVERTEMLASLVAPDQPRLAIDGAGDCAQLFDCRANPRAVEQRPSDQPTGVRRLPDVKRDRTGEDVESVPRAGRIRAEVVRAEAEYPMPPRGRMPREYRRCTVRERPFSRDIAEPEAGDNAGSSRTFASVRMSSVPCVVGETVPLPEELPHAASRAATASPAIPISTAAAIGPRDPFLLMAKS